MWIIAAISLILVGAVIFTCTMSVLKWDFTKLSTSVYETNEHEIIDDFSDIVINTDIADIKLVICNGQKCTVSCYEQTNAKHSVAVKDGTLTIELTDAREWYEYIGINFETPFITVCIPGGEYGSLSVRTSTGDVEIPKELAFKSINASSSTGDVVCRASALEKLRIGTNTGSITVEAISAGKLDLSVSTGSVKVKDVVSGDISVNVSTGGAELTNITCEDLRSGGGTGSITLKNVVASGSFYIERGTGSVWFDRSDADDIFIKTGTGGVGGSLLSDKVFVTSSGTGYIDVPKTVTGGRCEISTGTGDIRISIEQ
jgi:DUF4097 and DUF4098 domain-containing protein YvlB